MKKPISIQIHPDQKKRDVMVMELHGQLDSITSSEVEKSLEKLIDQKHWRIVVDMKNISYVSSAGWGIFLGILKEIKTNKGDLKLAGVTDDVMEIFKLLEIDYFLPTYKTAPEAVLSFS
jgi:anti-sigma B factor antagonist